MQWIAHRVSYFVARCFLATIQALPIEISQSVCSALAFFAYDVLRLRRGVLESNLRQAFPEMTARERRRLGRRTWEHVLLMVCEVALVYRKVRDTNWRDYIHIRDRRVLARLLLDQRPTVIISGHFGNFEVAGICTGLLGFSIHTIARTLDNPYLDRFVRRIREARGQYILPKQGSASQVASILESGGVITLLGDQHAGDRGCWVDFFGRPASCHKAIALFALANAAPLAVCYAQRRQRPLQFDIGVAGLVDPATVDRSLLDVNRLTRWYNQRLEEIIRAAPDQYWWLHRRWRDRPVRGKRRTAGAPPAQRSAA